MLNFTDYIALIMSGFMSTGFYTNQSLIFNQTEQSSLEQQGLVPYNNNTQPPQPFPVQGGDVGNGQYKSHYMQATTATVSASGNSVVIQSSVQQGVVQNIDDSGEKGDGKQELDSGKQKPKEQLPNEQQPG